MFSDLSRHNLLAVDLLLVGCSLQSRILAGWFGSCHLLSLEILAWIVRLLVPRSTGYIVKPKKDWYGVIFPLYAHIYKEIRELPGATIPFNPPPPLHATGMQLFQVRLLGCTRTAKTTSNCWDKREMKQLAGFTQLTEFFTVIRLLKTTVNLTDLKSETTLQKLS